MKDYFLRANSRKAIDEALHSAGLLLYVEGEIATNHEVNILDYIGQIPKETGRIGKDEDGSEYPESVLSADYHVNLRGTLTPEQEAVLPIIPWPQKPYRIPAGGLLK